jgi:hypothetical protein
VSASVSVSASAYVVCWSERVLLLYTQIRLCSATILVLFGNVSTPIFMRGSSGESTGGRCPASYRPPGVTGIRPDVPKVVLHPVHADADVLATHDA